jgi:hypothetical protein
MAMRPPDSSYFVDDRHALYCGAVLGVAMRHGLPIEVVADDAGNYTNELQIRVAPNIVITLIVPPPPDDWTLVGWEDTEAGST